MLFTPKIWKPWNQQKPRPNSKINWHNPLTRGLVFYVPLLEGAGAPRDYVKGLQASVGGIWGHVNAGASYNLAGARNVLGYRDIAVWPDSPPLDLTSAVSVAALCTRSATLAGANILSKSHYVSESSNLGYQLLCGAGGQEQFAVYNNNGSATYLMSGNSIAANQTLLATGTWISGSTNLYQNATLVTTKSITTMAAPVGFGVQIGENGTDKLMVHWAGIWNRVLTAREITQLTFNPYGFMAEPSPRLFWFAQSGGGSVGSYTISSSAIGSSVLP